MRSQEELNDAGAPGYGLTVEMPTKRFYNALLRLRSRLTPFYPDVDEQDLWMSIPHPLLHGSAAMDPPSAPPSSGRTGRGAPSNWRCSTTRQLSDGGIRA